MLGRQVGFYLDHEDSRAFLERVRSEFDCVLLDAQSPVSEPRVLRSVEEMGFSGFLCRRADVAHVRGKCIPRQGSWLLDVTDMPIVEWTQFREAEGRIRPGRLYWVPKAPSGDLLVEKSSEFLDFADQLTSLARRVTVSVPATWGSKIRVGPSVRRRMEVGDVVLARNS